MGTKEQMAKWSNEVEFSKQLPLILVTAHPISGEGDIKFNTALGGKEEAIKVLTDALDWLNTEAPASKAQTQIIEAYEMGKDYLCKLQYNQALGPEAIEEPLNGLAQILIVLRNYATQYCPK